MFNLQLAVKIADIAKEADQSDTPLDVETASLQLLEKHPEASQTEIQAALRETSVTVTG
ncbi:hypothetical protein [Tianweitania sp.]|uniref:hypothetical protein n=1 Tax=Tianweitania sp. TaxID=2021634 RepID=UPI002896A079|nr:hypothetical protein [Tianweitania sp.]